jgi:hypothetical protein
MQLRFVATVSLKKLKEYILKFCKRILNVNIRTSNAAVLDRIWYKNEYGTNVPYSDRIWYKFVPYSFLYQIRSDTAVYGELARYPLYIGDMLR